MRDTTRRAAILSAAAAAAAFGLDAPLAISAPPPRAATPDPAPGFHRFRIGAECTALYDGIWEKAHDPAFFRNATIADTKRALARARLTTRFIPIPIAALVVNVNARLVLCDAGGGDQVQAYNPQSVFTSGKMLANMRAAGIDPARIETILVSHFHPDHIFGLLERRSNAPVFPNAEIIVPAAEYAWWTDPLLIDQLPAARRRLARRIQAVIPKWRNVLPVAGEVEVVPGIRFVATPGHTAGHTCFHLSSGDQQLMIAGDAVYMPALVAANPGWHGVYDQDPPTAEASRRRLLDRVVAERMPICGSHFPWPGVGRIARDGAGYVFQLSRPDPPPRTTKG